MYDNGKAYKKLKATKLQNGYCIATINNLYCRAHVYLCCLEIDSNNILMLYLLKKCMKYISKLPTINDSRSKKEIRDDVKYITVLACTNQNAYI